LCCNGKSNGDILSLRLRLHSGLGQSGGRFAAGFNARVKRVLSESPRGEKMYLSG